MARIPETMLRIRQEQAFKYDRSATKRRDPPASSPQASQFASAPPFIGGKRQDKLRSSLDTLRLAAAVDTNSVRPKNISDLIPAARKIEFESCKELKTRSDSELPKKNWRNNSSELDFFRNILG